MLGLKRLIHHANSISPAILSSRLIITHGQDKPVSLPAQWSTNRFFEIYKMADKEAIEKDRARLTDEMNRGYFADIGELKRHGGKIAQASKIIIPAMVATKFPPLEVSYSDGRVLKLPIIPNGKAPNAEGTPNRKASLVCLSFRANSEAMINSWSVPFLQTFSASKDAELYEVSFIDSTILCWKPIKKLLLRKLRSSNPDEKNDALQRQIVYSFGDHYDFRKELKILNLLTGYIFLLDKFGRIRWHGSGEASKEELDSLLSCTSLLLEEK
uniref:AT1G08220-like protein n=1 Tax=Geranium phaeum TaxID=379952 RepID=A0A0G4AP70_9ROSI|nr:AT1G08220-like protein [Geranium phaeum]